MLDFDIEELALDTTYRTATIHLEMNPTRFRVLFATAAALVLVVSSRVEAQPPVKETDTNSKGSKVEVAPEARQVFPLKFANAKDLATVINELFATPSTTPQKRRPRGFGGGDAGDRGRGDQRPAGTSEAPQAASKVADADDQSNSLTVSATEDTLRKVGEIVARFDVSISDTTETRIFRLQHGGATEMAETINGLYADSSTQNQKRSGGQQGGGRGGFGQGNGGQAGGQQQNQRALLQTKVVTLGDDRTKSLLVSAGRETMVEIAEMVGRLDSTEAKGKRVFVHKLTHVDADSVANLLREMLGDGEPVKQVEPRPTLMREDFMTPLEKSRLVIPPTDRVRE